MEGYDVEVLHEISNDLYCMICLKLMRNPVQFKCGHGMCCTCYKNLSSRRQKKQGKEILCPQCRDVVDDHFVTSNKMLSRLILSLEVKCSRVDECLWIGELIAHDDHLESCPLLACDDDNMNRVVLQRRIKESNRLLEDDILSAVSQRLSTLESKLNDIHQIASKKSHSVFDDNSVRHKERLNLNFFILLPSIIAFFAVTLYGYNNSSSTLATLHIHSNQINHRLLEMSNQLEELNNLMQENTGNIKKLSLFHKKAYYNFEQLSAKLDDLRSGLNRDGMKESDPDQLRDIVDELNEFSTILNGLRTKINDSIVDIVNFRNQKLNFKVDLHELFVGLANVQYIAENNSVNIRQLLGKAEAIHSSIIDFPGKIDHLHSEVPGKVKNINLGQDLIRSIRKIPESIAYLQEFSRRSFDSLNKLGLFNIHVKLNNLQSEEQDLKNQISLFYIERNHTLNALDRKFSAHVEKAKTEMKTNVSNFEKDSLTKLTIENREVLQSLLNRTINDLNNDIFPEIEIHYIECIENSKLYSYNLQIKFQRLRSEIDTLVQDLKETHSDGTIRQKLANLVNSTAGNFHHLHPDYFVKVVSKQNEKLRHKFESIVNNFYINMKQVISYEEQFQRLLSQLQKQENNFRDNYYIWRIENWKSFGHGQFIQIGHIKNMYIDYSVYNDKGTQTAFLEFAFCLDEDISNFKIDVKVWNQYHEDDLVCLPTLNDVKKLSLIFDICKYYKTPLQIKEMQNQGFVKEDKMYVKFEISNIEIKPVY